MRFGKQVGWNSACLTVVSILLLAAMPFVVTANTAKEAKENPNEPKIVIQKLKKYSKDNAVNLGRAIGISYGTKIIVSYLHQNCIGWFPQQKDTFDAANKRWLEKNDQDAKQAKSILDDLIKMTSESKNSKAKRAMERFTGLRIRYESMMSRDLDKMQNQARKATCSRMVAQVNAGVLDVETRGKNVRKLLYGWNPQAFKEYMESQGSL